MTDPIPSTIRDIRKQLRLAMNGVVSTSMREKGSAYKLNFGVSLPKMREIAAGLPAESALAEALWKEDVRELKILATLIQPAELFTREQAQRWAAEITQPEIAEYLCAHLLYKLPYAGSLAMEWTAHSEEQMQTLAFLLFAHICRRGNALTPQEKDCLIREAHTTIETGFSRKQQAAILALKQYGRQLPAQATSVLSSFADYAHSPSPEKQEFYEELKFEFDYYQ